jgi:hypothetical protein
MADPVLTLCTPAQAQAWAVPGNAEPELVPLVIASVTAELARECGRASFFTSIEKETFHCRPSVTLRGPAKSVTSVVARCGYESRTLAIAEYDLDGDELTFTAHISGVLTCTYVRGWLDVADVPADLNQIAVELVCLDLKRRKRPDLRSETTQAGASSLTYDGGAREALVQRARDLYRDWSV